MRKLLPAFLAIALSACPALCAARCPAAKGPAGPSPDEPAGVPVAKIGKSGPRFLKLHESFLQRAKEGNIDLLFLGDSITERWHTAPEVWQHHYAQYNPANFG